MQGLGKQRANLISWVIIPSMLEKSLCNRDFTSAGGHSGACETLATQWPVVKNPPAMQEKPEKRI